MGASVHSSRSHRSHSRPGGDVNGSCDSSPEVASNFFRMPGLFSPGPAVALSTWNSWTARCDGSGAKCPHFRPTSAELCSACVHGATVRTHHAGPRSRGTPLSRVGGSRRDVHLAWSIASSAARGVGSHGCDDGVRRSSDRRVTRPIGLDGSGDILQGSSHRRAAPAIERSESGDFCRERSDGCGAPPSNPSR